MSSGMSVLRIQKLCTTSVGKMKSMPIPSGSSVRHISPRVRSGCVSAISTMTRCTPPNASWTTSVPRSGSGPS